MGTRGRARSRARVWLGFEAATPGREAASIAGGEPRDGLHGVDRGRGWRGCSPRTVSSAGRGTSGGVGPGGPVRWGLGELAGLRWPSRGTGAGRLALFISFLHFLFCLIFCNYFSYFSFFEKCGRWPTIIVILYNIATKDLDN